MAGVINATMTHVKAKISSRENAQSLPLAVIVDGKEKQINVALYVDSEFRQ